jgi:hypothetical protein
MKISIIGTGNLEIIHNHTKTNKKKLEKLLEGSAKLLAEIGAEIIILPARGIPYEFAKLYKKFGGKKVYGMIPAKCPYYEEKIPFIIKDYLDVVDEKINWTSFYDVDGSIATMGDYTLCFGFSAGVMCEIGEMKYNIKYRDRKTKLIIFENTMSGRLHKEVEEDISPIYINSVNELKKILK